MHVIQILRLLYDLIGSKRAEVWAESQLATARELDDHEKSVHGLSEDKRLRHLAHMCQRAVALAGGSDAQRHQGTLDLGFVQGALWWAGISTLADLETMNRTIQSELCSEQGSDPPPLELKAAIAALVAATKQARLLFARLSPSIIWKDQADEVGARSADLAAASEAVERLLSAEKEPETAPKSEGEPVVVQATNPSDQQATAQRSFVTYDVDSKVPVTPGFTRPMGVFVSQEPGRDLPALLTSKEERDALLQGLHRGRKGYMYQVDSDLLMRVVLDAQAAHVSIPVEGILSPRQQKGFRAILLRIASWTNARFDQHLRHEISDEDADAVLRFLGKLCVLPPECDPSGRLMGTKVPVLKPVVREYSTRDTRRRLNLEKEAAVGQEREGPNGARIKLVGCYGFGSEGDLFAFEQAGVLAPSGISKAIAERDYPIVIREEHLERPVSKKCIVDGKPTTLGALMADPDFSSLLKRDDPHKMLSEVLRELYEIAEESEKPTPAHAAAEATQFRALARAVYTHAAVLGEISDLQAQRELTALTERTVAENSDKLFSRLVSKLGELAGAGMATRLLTSHSQPEGEPTVPQLAGLTFALAALLQEIGDRDAKKIETLTAEVRRLEEYTGLRTDRERHQHEVRATTAAEKESP